MPWYKSGTANCTLNSAAVIGVGTSFIANSRVGDAFLGPDGEWYEVTNIASDTSMAIAPAYKGATTTGGSYALAPMQGYVKDSADALRAIVNMYGLKLGSLGTTGNYDILPVTKGGTGLTTLSVFIQGLLNDADAVEARATLIAAKSGANGDINSLSGLTTALSLTQGGTGANTAADARTNLGLKTGALVNVVGLTSAGDIMEVGTNAAGTYFKFQSGLMICRCTTFNMIVGANALTVFEGIGTPSTFVGDFQVIVTGVPTMSNLHYGWPTKYRVTDTSFGIVHFNGPTAQTMVTRVTLIGSWK